MRIQLIPTRRWVLWVLSALVVTATIVVALAPPGDPTYRATSSVLLTLQGRDEGVEASVDRLDSADTGNAVGSLFQILSDSGLQQRAMEEAGIGSGEFGNYNVTVTSPRDALLVAVEVVGPGPEVVDLAAEIAGYGAELAAGSFPELTLVAPQESVPTTTGQTSTIYLLLSMAVGFLTTLVLVGGAVLVAPEHGSSAYGAKEAVRAWIEGRPIPARGRSGPWPDLRSTLIVLGALIIYVVVAPGQGVWLASGALVGLATLVALRYPRPLTVGLVLLVLFNLSDIGTDYFGLPGTSVPYTLFVIVVLIVRVWALGEDRRGWFGLAIAIAALIAVMSISALTAGDQPLAFERTLDLVKNGLVAVLMVVLIRNLDDLRGVVWTLVLGTSFLAILGIARIALGEVPGILSGFAQVVTEVADEEVVGVRIAGPIGDANYFGQLLVLVFPFALDRAFREPRRLARGVAAGASLVLATAVVMTNSRGALIGLLAAGVLTLILIRPSFRLVLAGLVLSVFVLLALPSQYLERVASLGQVVQIGSGTGVEDASLRGRFGEMVVGLEMFHDHPIAGVGPGNYPGRYLEYSSTLGVDYRLELRQPHSLPIEVAAELGVLGLAWWAVAGYLLGSRLLRARRSTMTSGPRVLKHYLDAISASFVGFAATALFLHFAFARSLWMLVGIAMAAIRLSPGGDGASAPSAASLAVATARVRLQGLLDRLRSDEATMNMAEDHTA